MSATILQARRFSGGGLWWLGIYAGAACSQSRAVDDQARGRRFNPGFREVRREAEGRSICASCSYRLAYPSKPPILSTVLQHEAIAFEDLAAYDDLAAMVVCWRL